LFKSFLLCSLEVNSFIFCDFLFVMSFFFLYCFGCFNLFQIWYFFHSCNLFFLFFLFLDNTASLFQCFMFLLHSFTCVFFLDDFELKHLLGLSTCFLDSFQCFFFFTLKHGNSVMQFSDIIFSWFTKFFGFDDRSDTLDSADTLIEISVTDHGTLKLWICRSCTHQTVFRLESCIVFRVFILGLLIWNWINPSDSWLCVIFWIIVTKCYGVCRVLATCKAFPLLIKTTCINIWEQIWLCFLPFSLFDTSACCTSKTDNRVAINIDETSSMDNAVTHISHSSESFAAASISMRCIPSSSHLVFESFSACKFFERKVIVLFGIRFLATFSIWWLTIRSTIILQIFLILILIIILLIVINPGVCIELLIHATYFILLISRFVLDISHFIF